MNILITGATGFVGTEVVSQLISNGDKAIILTRNVEKAFALFAHLPQAQLRYFQWNPLECIPPKEALEEAHGVINLMGENLMSKRWSQKQKDLIRDSRVIGSKNLITGLLKYGDKVHAISSASALGIYKTPKVSEVQDENFPVTDSFLGSICERWEFEIENSQARTTIIRIGVALGRTGGLMKQLSPIFKLGIGGKISSGEQFMSWMHVDDLANLFITSIKNKNFSGKINATVAQPVSNKEFTRILGVTLKKPTFFTIPAFLLKLVMGKEKASLALKDQKGVTSRLEELEFDLRYPSLQSALKEIFYK